MEPVDICEVTKQACDLIAQLAAERDISIEEGSPSGSRRAMADRQRLMQVMLNLLSNAVKYNRRGGSIKIACELEEKDTTLVTVSDTGLGIDPDKMAGLLFKPFERLGAEASGVEGTGLWV